MSTEKISTSGQKVTRKNPQKGGKKMKSKKAECSHDFPIHLHPAKILCDECVKKIKEAEGADIIVIGKAGTYFAGEAVVPDINGVVKKQWVRSFSSNGKGFKGESVGVLLTPEIEKIEKYRQAGVALRDEKDRKKAIPVMKKILERERGIKGKEAEEEVEKFLNRVDMICRNYAQIKIIIIEDRGVYCGKRPEGIPKGQLYWEGNIKI